jgi:cytochrome c
MGALEIKAGWIEASAYRKIRETLSDKQTSQMMQLRGNYIVDQTQVESLTFDQRGAQLAILCAGCHGGPGQHRTNMIGPTLDGMFDRPIGTAAGFDFSDSLKASGAGNNWNPEILDAFLRAPKSFAPGTKMEFQGLLNAEDRRALIQYLQRTR